MTIIFTITGPSCSGKSTLVKSLEKTGKFKEVVSTTTREKRTGERDGTDYHFVTEEDFKDKIDFGDFIEYEIINDKYYGITFESLSDCYKVQKIPIAVLDPKGVKSLRKSGQVDRVYSIYMDLPIEDLYKRFLERFRSNKESNVDFEVKRLISLSKEHRTWWQDITYDYSIVNFTSETEQYTITKILDLARKIS